MRGLVYAHRGGAALAPENTIAAFDRGIAAGAGGLECDVRLSRDGVPIVHHDATLERTTNGRGSVATCTADELARLDAAHQFSAGGGFPFRGQGIGVPRLEEVVRRYPGAQLIVDMKEDLEALADAVIAVLRKAGAIERATVASFHLPPLLAARKAGSGVITGAATPEVRGALYRSWRGRSPRNPPYRGFQVPERRGLLRIVSPRFVRAVTRAGLSVSVWTVNEEADMRRLLDWGVTGLITDRPDIAVAIVRSAFPR